MKRIFNIGLFLISLILLLTNISFAQQPVWVDYAKRTSMYPETDYLTGFVSGNNINDEDPGKLLDKYEELAKNKVVESIEVSIETNNSLILSNKNGKSDENFESKSVSFSSATITGLKSERYYDSRKKEAYVFAYASKKELAYYNRKLIETNLQKIDQKLTEGRDFEKNNDKQNALKSFYEGMPLLAQAEEAQWLLMAINREQFIDEDLKKLRSLNADLTREIAGLQQSGNLNLNEAAYFAAFGLFLQIGESSTPLLVNLCTYQNTGLTSDFSTKWDQEFKNALIKTGGYQITEFSNGKNQLVEGNYWEENGMLKVQMKIISQNKILAMAEANVSINYLSRENINFVPVQLKKISDLSELEVQALSGPSELKIGKQSDTCFEVVVTKKNESSLISVQKIPLKFQLKNGQVVGKSITNEEGKAKFFFPEIKVEEGKNELIAAIDLGAYADLDTNSLFYVKTEMNNPVVPALFEVQFIPLFYYVESSETIDNKPVEVKIIELALKKLLSENGFQFVNQEPDADYIVEVKAATTAGNSHDGIYFSYVDATLSIVDAQTGVEKYKTSVEQVKGGGSNPVKAGIKALNQASGQLSSELLKYLSK